jgi:TolB protein
LPGVKQKPAENIFPLSNLSFMSHPLRFFLGLLVAVPLLAQNNSVRDLGEVVVTADLTTIPVNVSSPSPDLQNLAQVAFNAHGRYRLVAGNAAFALTFFPVGANSVEVTVTKGSAATLVLKQVVSGTSLHNALLRAADLAVTKTSGLRGFFAGKLAFVANAGGQETVMTGDLFFTEVFNHPVQGKQIIGPRWSPDGSKIIFTSYRSDFPDIYVLDLRTRQLNVFASFKGTNSGGRFSPDGTRVAMILSGEGNPEVYVGNAQGRQLHRLTNNQSVEASPAWSPDGTRMVLVSDAAGGPQLYFLGATGGSMSRVPTNISKYCAEPDWSVADPTKIVFTAGVGRNAYQVAVYDMGTQTSKIVSAAPTDAIEPVWLADGRHVVCTFRAANSRRLYLLDTESHKATPLSPTALGNVSNASYLPP